MKRGRKIPRGTVLEGIGQVQLQKGDEIREYPWMTLRRVQRQLVEVEYETLHGLHMMIGLAANLAYLIVRHVDHLQIRQTVQSAEHVPRQLLQVVPGKDEHLNGSKLSSVSYKVITRHDIRFLFRSTCHVLAFRYVDAPAGMCCENRHSCNSPRTDDDRRSTS